MREIHRRTASLVGLILWLGYPFAFLAGISASWQDRCGERSFSGTFDDCFNDYIPIAELMMFPLALLLAYPMARFAFSMFAPQKAARSSKWRLAGREAGGAYAPLFQILAALGLAWSIWHLAAIPTRVSNWYLILYWSGWCGWFVLGALVSLPNRTERN